MARALRDAYGWKGNRDFRERKRMIEEFVTLTILHGWTPGLGPGDRSYQDCKSRELLGPRPRARGAGGTKASRPRMSDTSPACAWSWPRDGIHYFPNPHRVRVELALGKTRNRYSQTPRPRARGAGDIAALMMQANTTSPACAWSWLVTQGLRFTPPPHARPGGANLLPMLTRRSLARARRCSNA